MDYTDPHHKRIEFRAVSYRSETIGAVRRVMFFTNNPNGSVTLVERGPLIAAIVAKEDCDFILWKVQILDNLNWLILDIKDNPKLSRIVVVIEGLDATGLDVELKEMFAGRSLLYYNH